jgi:preprotein translocase subunit SecE
MNADRKERNMAGEQTVANDQTPQGGIVNFARETRREIGKVTWPTRKEITVTTSLIVVFALVAGLFFLVVDGALGFIVTRILGMAG